MKTLTKKELKNLIPVIENDGKLLDNWIADESQTISNSCNQSLYEYKGERYLITEYNERSEKHKEGYKEIIIWLD